MESKFDSTGAIAVPINGRLNRYVVVIKSHQKAIGAIAILLLAGALAYVWWSRKDTGSDYVTDKVTRGAIEVDVSATGTVQAVTTVQVGSQVSGTVSWLGADFKSHVTHGQIVAKLDPALFQAQVNTAQANLLNAQAGVQAALTEIQNQTANVEAAKANDRANAAQRDDAIAIAKQNERLKGIIPDREIEAAQNAARAAIARYNQATSQIGQAQAQLEISKAKLKQSQAAVAQAKAQLDQANVNLEHSVITSPIDGVVVSRSVDVGQTVAASLQAPTLFIIANDLTNMQVLASIDEADVGQIREGGKARFTVDAFSGQPFFGEITQVRLNAQTVQNVVTYTAVISVANPDQKLMPGMTTNITIPVARRDNVLRVPNAALRFKPDLTDQQQKDLQAKMEVFRQQPQSQSQNETEQQGSTQNEKIKQDQSQNNSAGNAGSDAKQRHQQATPSRSGGENQGSNQSSDSGSRRRDGGQRQQDQGQAANKNEDQGQKQPGQAQQPGDNQTTEGRGARGGQRQIQVIWVMTANKTLEPRIVRTGITDGKFTEIASGDLNEGDVVVTGQSETAGTNRNQQTTTPFQQRPPGAGGGGRGR